MLSRLLCVCFLRALFMQHYNERWSWWRAKKRTQLLFLVAIYGISFSPYSRPICGFCFWWTQKSSFVSLIDFCNNSSHFAYERMEELMNYIMLRYFLHRSLDEIMVKKNDCKDERSRQSEANRLTVKSLRTRLINSFKEVERLFLGFFSDEYVSIVMKKMKKKSASLDALWICFRTHVDLGD